jgi:hypothetical protein
MIRGIEQMRLWDWIADIIQAIMDAISKAIHGY